MLFKVGKKGLMKLFQYLRKINRPVCEWKGTDGFGIHLHEKGDKAHKDLVADIAYKLDQGDSPIKIGREMGMTTAVIKGVIKLKQNVILENEQL